MWEQRKILGIKALGLADPTSGCLHPASLEAEPPWPLETETTGTLGQEMEGGGFPHWFYDIVSVIFN